MAFLPSQYDQRLGYSAQQDRLYVASILQQGVIGAGDLKASAATGFASQVASGTIVVPNTFTSSNGGGSYVATNVGAVSKAHAVPDPSSPRLDTLFVKVYDSYDGGDASDIADFVIVPGAVQGGNPSATALLASRAGVGAVPTNAQLVADCYVPGGAASAASFIYRDRRPFARGFHSRIKYTLGNITLGSINGTQLDGTNLAIRAECTNVPVKLTLSGNAFTGVPGSQIIFGFLQDGGNFDSFNGSGYWTQGLAANGAWGFTLSYEYLPGAGSHLFQPTGCYSGTGGIVAGIASTPLLFIVEERVTQVGNNGTS